MRAMRAPTGQKYRKRLLWMSCVPTSQKCFYIFHLIPKTNTLVLHTPVIYNPVAPYSLVKTMRASFYVLGPLLSRFEYAKDKSFNISNE